MFARGNPTIRKHLDSQGRKDKLEEVRLARCAYFAVLRCLTSWIQPARPMLFRHPDATAACLATRSNSHRSMTYTPTPHSPPFCNVYNSTHFSPSGTTAKDPNGYGLWSITREPFSFLW